MSTRKAIAQLRTRQLAGQLFERFRGEFQPKVVKTEAHVTYVATDAAGRATGATSMINNLPEQRVYISYGAQISAGDTWEVTNEGSASMPIWVATRRLKAAAEVPSMDPTVSLPTPTGLTVSAEMETTQPATTTPARVLASWLGIGAQYGNMRYEVECATNDLAAAVDRVFVVDAQPVTTLALAIDDSQTVIPRAADGTNFADVGRIQIQSERIDYTSTSSGTGDSGASGTGAAGSFTVAGETWALNQWRDFCLVDSAGDVFLILTSTSTVLVVDGTPASGAWSIRPAFGGCTRGAGSTSAAAHDAGTGVGGLSVNASFTGKLAGTDYNLRVRANSNAGGVSTWTAWASVTTPTDSSQAEGTNLLSNADWERDSDEGYVPDGYAVETVWGTAWTGERGAYGRYGTTGVRLTIPAGSGGLMYWPEPLDDWLVVSETGQWYVASVYFHTTEAAGDLYTGGGYPHPAGKLAIQPVVADHDGNLAIGDIDIGDDTVDAGILESLRDNWYRVQRKSPGRSNYTYVGWMLYIRNNLDHEVVLDLDRPQLELGVRASSWSPGLSPAGGAAGSMSYDIAGIKSANLNIGPTGLLRSAFLPDEPLTRDMGAPDSRLGTVYCDAVDANTVIGTLEGSVWSSDVNMAINPDDDVDTVLTIENTGDGDVCLHVVGDITLTGTVDGVDLAGFKSAYDSHAHPGLFVRVATGDTITAQHSFSPAAPAAPFVLGANAQGQLVAGLNADQLDGLNTSTGPAGAAVLATDASGRTQVKGLGIGVAPSSNYLWTDCWLGSNTNTILGVGAAGGGGLTHNADYEGWFNTIVGAEAGLSLTTGSENLFFGSNAGYSSTTAYRSIGIGHSALIWQTTGQNNTAIGAWAGGNLTTGSSNLAVGASALAGVVTGGGNIGIGANTLDNAACTAAQGNIAIGTYSLRAVTADHNIAIGNSAGAGAGGSYMSIFIGYASDTAIAGPLYSIALGPLSKVYASNQLVIGSDLDSGAEIRHVYVGPHGYQSADIIKDVTVHASGGRGTDNIGSELRLAGGQGTGAGAGGSIVFQTAPAGATGTNLNALVTRATLDSTGQFSIGAHVLPAATDTYDLGKSTLLWRKGWLSELDAILFAQNTKTLLGGWFSVQPDEGALPANVAAADTTIDFGKAMTAGHFVEIRAAGAVEYMQVGALVSGTTYKVGADGSGARNLDGSGANDWPAGTVFAVNGAAGQGRIELDAYDTPRLRLLLQGVTYNAQTELLRLGDLNGNWGYGVAKYGIAIGQYAAGKANICLDEDGAVSIRLHSTERIGLTAAGVLAIKDSGGAAVFTFDAASGAEFTKMLTLGAAGGIYQGTGTAGTPTTGLKLWNDGGVGRLAGYSGGVLQAGFATDGTIIAGYTELGGNIVILDAAGIKVRTGTNRETNRGYRLIDSSDDSLRGILDADNSSLNLEGYLSGISIINKADSGLASGITFVTRDGSTTRASLLLYSAGGAGCDTYLSLTADRFSASNDIRAGGGLYVGATNVDPATGMIQATVGASGWLPFVNYQSLSAGISAGTVPFMATIPRDVTLRSFSIAAFVLATNDANNYWTLTIKTAAGATLQTLSTASMSAGTWTVLTGSTWADATLGTSDKAIYIEVAKAGSGGAPGNLYLGAPALFVS